MNADFTLQVEQSLRSLGFTRHEVQSLVYLIRRKKATGQDLSRETMIPFNMATAVLSNLVRRKLVEVKRVDDLDVYTFCGKTAFEKWLKEEKLKHNSIYDQASQDMGQFMSNSEQDQWQPEILFYEGVDGIREIYDDMRNSGQDIYACTDLLKLMNLLGEKFVKEFITYRRDNDIRMFTIRSKAAHKFFADKDLMEANNLREVKVVDKLSLNGEIKIYGDKSALITFDGEKPVGFVFNGGPTAELMKSFFKTLWNSV